jgi:hypothetical protein
VPAAEDDRSRVVRAHVRARVLGLPLLTVDARIDIGPPGSRAEALDAPALRVRIPRPRPGALGPVQGGMRRAQELLEEVARTA